jgi:gamma-D-glutamyl-L-lysine dipeptidyl-peptidase
VTQLVELVERVRSQAVLDARSSVFDVTVEQRGTAFALAGRTTERHTAQELVAAARRLLGDDVQVYDEIVRLPHDALGDHVYAVVTAAVAPVYAEPRLPAPQISQVVMGMRVDVLEHSGPWLRVRAEDAYLGWVHGGYIRTGDADWAHTWERGLIGEPVVSLGAELADADGRIVGRAPWGARLIRFAPLDYGLPDGRRAQVRSGEVVDVDRLADWFPLRGDSVARTARRWLGAPYLWGGITASGTDCSGFTQAVFWMHGVALPRDSDLQSRIGATIDTADGFASVRAGDLLYFAEPGARVTHVGISVGGAQMVHSALSNGGVAFNDLDGDGEFDRRLRALFTHARRLLPD